MLRVKPNRDKILILFFIRNFGYLLKEEREGVKNRYISKIKKVLRRYPFSLFWRSSSWLKEQLDLERGSSSHNLGRISLWD